MENIHKVRQILQQHPIRVLLLSVVLIYASGLDGEFVNDDITYFIYNDILPNLKFWQLGEIFFKPSNYWGELLPLRDLLYVAQYNLFGTNPFGYHVVSLALYLAILYTLYGLLEKTSAIPGGDKAGIGTVVFATAFFALHPVHVESVAYISGQKDLLCALFSLLSAALFYQLINDGKYDSLRCWSSFLICYYGAFLSKSLAVSTALILTICGFYWLRDRKGFWSRYVPIWFLVNIPVLFWILYVFSVSDVQGMAGAGTLSVLDRCVQAIRIYGGHFKLALWPYPLNFGYPFTPGAVNDLYFWLGLAGLLFLVCVLFVKDNLIKLASLIILVYLLPVSQLFNDLFNAYLYDRYLFIPILGFGLMIGKYGALALRHNPVRRMYVLSTLVIAVFVLLTLNYIPVYRNDVSVARQAYDVFPEGRSSSFNYAVALIEAGELGSATTLIESEQSLQKPIWVKGYLSGWIRLKNGDTEEAITVLRPAFYQTLVGGYYPFPGVALAKALSLNGQPVEAVQTLEMVLRAKIHNPLHYYQARELKMNILNESGWTE